MSNSSKTFGVKYFETSGYYRWPTVRLSHYVVSLSHYAAIERAFSEGEITTIVHRSHDHWDDLLEMEMHLRVVGPKTNGYFDSLAPCTVV